MKRYASSFLLAMLIFALAAGSAVAVKKPPVKKVAVKKVAVKKPVTTTHHETLGTQQLKGEYGQIGHTYTLGKSYPWNVTLKSAEYTVDTIRFGGRILYPARDKKFLVLHYTVHNPQKSQALMRFDTFHVTAVDANDKNWEGVGELGSEETGDRIEQQFKPAQKMDVYTAVLVPAAGEIPKIIIKASDNLVIRYNLLGKAKPLPEPYADTNDKTGATAFTMVPAKPGVFFPVGQYAIKLDGISYTDQAVGNYRLSNGGRFLVVNMTAKGLDTVRPVLRFDTFRVKLLDTDGTEVDWKGDLFKASSDGTIEMNLEQDQEVKFRLLFSVDKGVTPKTLAISQGQSRVYQFEVQ